MSNYLIKFIEDIDKRLNFNKEVKLSHKIDDNNGICVSSYMTDIRFGPEMLDKYAQIYILGRDSREGAINRAIGYINRSVDEWYDRYH